MSGGEVQTVDGRELHRFLAVGRDFATWMRDRIDAFGFERGIDYLDELSPGLGEKGQGRPSRDYHLTLDMAKELAMVERSAKGREARRYFIECERRMQAIQPMAALNDPLTLRSLLLAGTDRELALKADVASLAPKADALDRLATADGSLCRTDAAKVLQVPPKVLIDFMRERRWTYMRSGSTEEVAFQDKIASGVLEHKTTTIPRGDGTSRVRVQVRVTPKGLARLGRELPASENRQ